MIVKLIAPGIIPNDYVTVDLQGVPNRGDTVLVYDDGEEIALTVKSRIWPVEIPVGVRNRALAVDIPELVCELQADAGIDNPATITVYNSAYEQIDQYQKPVTMTVVNNPKD